MSRFSALKKHLGLANALSVYFKLKIKKTNAIKVSKLLHPFEIRNNPYDYAMFEEVILQETYNIPLQIQPKNIIDGGGNIGLTACFFATKFPAANIITIEPDDENFTVLNNNIKKYPNVTAIKSGVWNKKVYLRIIDVTAGNNSFIVEETNESDKDAIPAISISYIMEKFGWEDIDILKLDIEGSEKEVFSSDYESWLPKVKVLIIELHDKMKPGCSQAVFSAITKYNFSFDIRGENIIFTNLAFSS